MRYAPGMTDYEVLDHADTPIGTLFLARRQLDTGQVVTDVMIDGALLMSDEYTASERALATSALRLHGGRSGLRALVGGLGLGYTAQAALAGGAVAELEVVDRLPVVAGWLERGLLPLSSSLADEKRMRVVEDDVYQRLLGEPTDDRWDLLLIDVDHAPSDPLDRASAPFYSAEGQRSVMRHLAPGGVLAVWSAHDDDPFAAVLEAVYPHAEREYVRWDCPYLGELVNTLFLAKL